MLLHAGLARLRLPPAQFWGLTPIELAAALGAFAPRLRHLGQRDLAQLMAAYPDQDADERVARYAARPGDAR
ncbi:hypothetical protein BJF93_19415 [Xaviernesmea oryzae]|uniref:Phage tail assembly chaperone n=1 Tax=Xaviernesmea oryzae TaxID=464029 RepID=A0A1Q9B1G8_9HYPH|nr:hypothetical protein BJF93_19415 [Xaviernesmea oryzae]